MKGALPSNVRSTQTHLPTKVYWVNRITYHEQHWLHLCTTHEHYEHNATKMTQPLDILCSPKLQIVSSSIYNLQLCIQIMMVSQGFCDELPWAFARSDKNEYEGFNKLHDTSEKKYNATISWLCATTHYCTKQVHSSFASRNATATIAQSTVKWTSAAKNWLPTRKRYKWN